MKVSELVLHFSVMENVPIDVQDDVVPVVLGQTGIEVYFWKADINTDVLLGQMTHESYPKDGKEVEMVCVDYARSLSNEVARLVCCKELVHILDPIDHRVMTDAALNELIEKIVLPKEMQGLNDGEKVWSDRFAFLYAIAILFPWAVRELFKGPFDARKITIDEIADMVELPVEYAALVMSDIWPSVHHTLTN